MSDEIHVILSPQVLPDAKAQLTLSFDSPTEADKVTVQLFEVDAWGTGPNRVVEPGGRDVLIAELTGSIVGGKFKLDKKDPKGVTGDKPSVQLHIDGEDKPVVVHDLPIPAAALANEQGIFEIEARVKGTVKKKPKSAKTAMPVFMRNFKAGRPIVAFITGGGEDYFINAELFWKSVADGVFDIASVESIREFVRTASDARGFGPWGDVNIVSHGNEFEWIIAMFTADRARNHIHVKDVKAARSDSRFSASVTSQLDDKGRVIIRGCAIGNDQALLDEIRQLFGGKSVVLAPKFLQTYIKETSGTTAAAREAFFETFFFYVPGSTAPSDADCKARLAKENPAVADADWLPMLQRAQKTGRMTPAELEEQFKGFRHDRTETFETRFTFTFTHPAGQPASDKQGQGVDFVDMVRQSWKKDEEHFNTDFGEWTPTQGGLERKELDKSTTEFARKLVMRRHRVEVRRLMKDSAGKPVKPDVDNPKHFGRSPPFGTKP